MSGVFWPVIAKHHLGTMSVMNIERGVINKLDFSQKVGVFQFTKYGAVSELAPNILAFERGGYVNRPLAPDDDGMRQNLIIGESDWKVWNIHTAPIDALHIGCRAAEIARYNRVSNGVLFLRKVAARAFQNKMSAFCSLECKGAVRSGLSGEDVSFRASAGSIQSKLGVLGAGGGFSSRPFGFDQRDTIGAPRLFQRDVGLLQGVDQGSKADSAYEQLDDGGPSSPF